MNILSAIYAGKTGFLRATASVASRAERLSNPNQDESQAVEDFVGLQVDKEVARANAHTIKVADQIVSELIQSNLKK